MRLLSIAEVLIHQKVAIPLSNDWAVFKKVS